MPSPETRPALAEPLLTFINEMLPSLDRRARQREPVELDTPLFATGRLDSLSILHLLVFLEDLVGAPIPDSLVVMRHFQSVATIAETFANFSPARP
jgi:acyl carrier protein